MAPNPVSLLMHGLNLLIFLGCAAVGARKAGRRVALQSFAPLSVPARQPWRV